VCLGESKNTSPRFTPLGTAGLPCMFGMDTGFPSGLPNQPDLIEVDLQAEMGGEQQSRDGFPSASIGVDRV